MDVGRQKLRKNCEFNPSIATLSHEMDVGRQKLTKNCEFSSLMFFSGRPDIDVLAIDMRKELLLKITGHLGEGQEVQFPGRDIRRIPEAVEPSMSQTYVEKILEALEMQDCRSVTAPGVDTLKKVADFQQVSPEMQKLYRRVVGQLLWLSNLRCDIMYAVTELQKD